MQSDEFDFKLEIHATSCQRGELFCIVLWEWNVQLKWYNIKLLLPCTSSFRVTRMQENTSWPRQLFRYPPYFWGLKVVKYGCTTYVLIFWDLIKSNKYYQWVCKYIVTLFLTRFLSIFRNDYWCLHKMLKVQYVRIGHLSNSHSKKK